MENIKPAGIERRSMEIIESELGETPELSEKERTVLKRVIHATADFEYRNNLKFSPEAVENGLAAIKSGAVIITDTNMALSGISKPALNYLGCEAVCFMGDADIAEKAAGEGTTRASAAVDKAALLYSGRKIIYAVGNAPTALLRLDRLIKERKLSPALIIGVPVGFVNVVQSKEVIMSGKTPYICAAGRKGGSTVSAAICNALLYMLYSR